MRHFYLFCITLISTIFTAHATEAPKLWSIKAGVNFANFTNLDYSSNFQTGFNIGIRRAFAISTQLPIYVESGVSLEMKGARITGGLSEKSKLKSYALEIPITIGYHVSITKSSAIYPFVGLYYSVALGGKLEANGESINPYKSEGILVEAAGEILYTRMLTRSDIGIRIGADYKYLNYSIGLAYDAGLNNVYAQELRNRNYKATTGCVSITLGYYF